MRIAIETVLDEDLPGAFSKELFDAKTEAIYQHVYDSYYGANKSVYAGVA